MAKFRFYQDKEITSWVRDYFEVNAETLEDAIALVKDSDCSLDEMESKDANVAFLHRDWDWMHDVLADCCDQDVPERYGIYSCDLDDCDEIVAHY